MPTQFLQNAPKENLLEPVIQLFGFLEEQQNSQVRRDAAIQEMALREKMAPHQISLLQSQAETAARENALQKEEYRLGITAQDRDRARALTELQLRNLELSTDAAAKVAPFTQEIIQGKLATARSENEHRNAQTKALEANINHARAQDLIGHLKYASPLASKVIRGELEKLPGYQKLAAVITPRTDDETKDAFHQRLVNNILDTPDDLTDEEGESVLMMISPQLAAVIGEQRLQASRMFQPYTPNPAYGKIAREMQRQRRAMTQPLGPEGPPAPGKKTPPPAATRPARPFDVGEKPPPLRAGEADVLGPEKTAEHARQSAKAQEDVERIKNDVAYQMEAAGTIGGGLWKSNVGDPFAPEGFSNPEEAFSTLRQTSKYKPRAYGPGDENIPPDVFSGRGGRTGRAVRPHSSAQFDRLDLSKGAYGVPAKVVHQIGEITKKTDTKKIGHLAVADMMSYALLSNPSRPAALAGIFKYLTSEKPNGQRELVKDRVNPADFRVFVSTIVPMVAKHDPILAAAWDKEKKEGSLNALLEAYGAQ